MAEAADSLLTAEQLSDLSYRQIKEYAKKHEVEVPFGTLKKGIIRLIYQENLVKEELEEPKSPVAAEMEAEAFTFNETEEDFTEVGRRPTVRFSNGPMDIKSHGGGRKRGSSRRKTNFWTALDIMKSIHLFADWEPTKVGELVKGLQTVEFTKGMALTEQGEKGDEFYIIIDGVCEVFVDGKKIDHECKEGDYIGELALLSKDCMRTATVKAKRNVTCLACSAQKFHEIIKGSVTWSRRNKQRKAVGVKKKKKKKKKQKSEAQPGLTPEEIKFLVGAISRLEFFADYTDAQLRELANQMKKKSLKDEHVIIRQGDMNADTFYVVGKGKFDIIVDKQKVAEKHVGQCVGEIALMFDQPRSATVVASGDSEIWELRRDVFRDALGAFVKAKNDEMQKYLKSVPAFEKMTPREIANLCAAFDRMELPSNTCIIREGDRPNKDSKCYVLVEGTVRWHKDEEKHLSKPATQRPSVFEGTLNAPTLFGELALLNDEPRAATITTVTDCVILHIAREEFNDLLGNLDELQNRTADFYDQLVEMQQPQQEDRLSPSVLKDATALDKLVEVGILGKGAYGLVTLVKDPKDNKSYALKAIKKSKVVENGMEEYIMGEKNIMQKLENPFLVNLKTTYMTSKHLYFLLEVCLGGELFTLLRDKNYFKEPTARFYAGCVVEGFAYMHSLNIIYRDLKPENLVLDNRGYLKIADFGFAKEITDRTYTFCGTPDYLAPEIINGKGHTFGVDWWTLGILLFEMLSSTPPFVDHEVHLTYKKILKSHVKFPRFFSKTAKTLILGLLRKKQTRRLGMIKGGADTIRKHPFFEQATEWDWKKLQEQTMTPPYVPKIKDEFDLQNFGMDSDSEESESEEAQSIEESEDEFFDGFDS